MNTTERCMQQAWAHNTNLALHVPSSIRALNCRPALDWTYFRIILGSAPRPDHRSLWWRRGETGGDSFFTRRRDGIVLGIADEGQGPCGHGARGLRLWRLLRAYKSLLDGWRWPLPVRRLPRWNWLPLPLPCCLLLWKVLSFLFFLSILFLFWRKWKCNGRVAHSYWKFQGTVAYCFGSVIRPLLIILGLWTWQAALVEDDMGSCRAYTCAGNRWVRDAGFEYR